jgi:hypothetical protein
MPETLDIFEDDAFSMTSLTATVNNVDFVPGRAGELCFVGNIEGITTETAFVEQMDTALTLLKTQPRGAPANQMKTDKRKVMSLVVPHIPVEDTINASEIQGVRAFGSENRLQGVQQVVSQRQMKMVRSMDLTLEHMRLGAIKGEVKDADGSTLYNLFTTFGVSQQAAVNFALDSASTEVRTKNSEVIRKMRKAAKMPLPSTARVWAFCGDNWFDQYIEHDSTTKAYDGYQAAERRLGESYVDGVYYHAGIYFENYRGSDDDGVSIDTNEARFFYAGVPGMWEERYAPGDFLETANTVGLPRYSKIGRDPSGMNRFVNLHVQSNPISICTRPQTLMRGTPT